jgi:hypothetical protein
VKKAYLPEVKEHREILAFYEKALKTGVLFKIEWSKAHNEYRTHLNHDILLKTNYEGGGKFGYPDSNYVNDLLKIARNLK